MSNNEWSFMCDDSTKQNYSMSFKFLPRQPHHSPTNFLKNYKNTQIHPLPSQFVPFIQERDHMGRLIKNNKQQPQTSSPAIPLQKEVSQGGLSTNLSGFESKRVPTIERLSQVEESINREFEMKVKEEIKSSGRNKISFRKSSLQIPFKKNSEEEVCLPKIKETTEPSGKMRKGSEHTAVTEPQSPLLRRNTSLVEVKSIRKGSLNTNQIDLIRETICSRSPVKFKQEGKGKTVAQSDCKSSPLHLTIKQEVVTSKIEHRQISELNRYNTFKTLGLKLAGSLEQGHSIFIAKMRETKKLAFKLKMNIEST